jgi:transposase
VAAIALAHGINANLLFKWRREGGARSPQTLANVPVLLPITVDGVVAPEGRSGPLRGTCGGTIELKLGSARLRLHGAVDVPSLLALVRVLREAS